MIGMTGLRTALLDLLHAVRDTEVRLIIGGGFGIYLKSEHVLRLGARSLFKEWPEPRSTNDLDLFLRPELLIKPEKLKPLAEGLARLGYEPVPGAEKYQFKKPGPGGSEAGSIKIDILTGPESRFQDTRVKTDDRRARPDPSVGIHAHPVNEAPTLEEGLLTVNLNGKLSSGEDWEAEVPLPHPYTFLMMKLFAFRDRLRDPDPELCRYHALDMYTILASTMEGEWDQALAIRDRRRDEPYIKDAGNLVAEYFSALSRQGMIKLRESRYYQPSLETEEFMSALQELFPLHG